MRPSAAASAAVEVGNLPVSNRLLAVAGPLAKSYAYDAAGNVLSDGIHAYGYDDRGRLTDVDAGSVSYAHNGQGQRYLLDRHRRKESEPRCILDRNPLPVASTLLPVPMISGSGIPQVSNLN